MPIRLHLGVAIVIVTLCFFFLLFVFSPVLCAYSPNVVDEWHGLDADLDEPNASVLIVDSIVIVGQDQL